VTVTGKNVKNSSLTGTDIKNSSLTTNDVKNRSLLAKDFKAGQLPAGPQGPHGTQGIQGVAGAPGTARAWAHVQGNGTVTASKGMEVAYEGAGEYCVKTPFTPNVVVATPKWQGVGAASIRFATGGIGGFGTCASDLPGTNAWVVVQDGTGAVTDTEFFVMADG
jgi:hypothetical protein